MSYGCDTWSLTVWENQGKFILVINQLDAQNLFYNRLIFHILLNHAAGFVFSECFNNVTLARNSVAP
jgi:hypothetical protein